MEELAQQEIGFAYKGDKRATSKAWETALRLTIVDMTHSASEITRRTTYGLHVYV